MSPHMNLDTNKAFARLDGALRRATVFDNAKEGPRWRNRIEKLSIRPVAYSAQIISKKLRLNFPARTFWGRKLILPSWDANAATVCYSGLLTVGDTDLVRYLLRRIRKDEVFYDIGANYGFYTALAADIATSGEVHAFEPVPFCFSYLKRNFGGDRKVVLNSVALSDSVGHIKFYDASASGRSVASSVFRAAFEGTGVAYKQIDVPVTTLDAYLERNPPPTLLKIDAEGSEYMLLKAASRTLRTAPEIVMEVLGKSFVKDETKKALRLLDEHGYVPFRIMPDGSLKEERHLEPADDGQPNDFVFKKYK
jgi:FkbM family methyltransferase